MSIDPQHAAGLRAGLLGQLMVEHHTTFSVIEHVPEDKRNFKVHPQMRTLTIASVTPKLGVHGSNGLPLFWTKYLWALLSLCLRVVR
jgi:hypothetical protein